MCVGVLEQFEEAAARGRGVNLVGGILSIPHSQRVGDRDRELVRKYKIRVVRGAANNVPDLDSLRATNEILAMIDQIKQATQRSLIISLISGGGSALLCAPVAGITFETKRAIIEKLMKSGCGIETLNKLRIKLSAVKGSRQRDHLILTALSRRSFGAACTRREQCRDGQPHRKRHHRRSDRTHSQRSDRAERKCLIARSNRHNPQV